MERHLEPAPARVRALRAQLLAWYAAKRRDLPWRRTRDSYAVWISEAMLQQTRVETVIPYWERFLERLPTVEHLAEADEEEVVALWSGLGYYRRARALRAAARVLVERHGGRFPRERAAALALPGVGPYTAGAVLSIAYDLPEPLVDGNVARVLARWFDLDRPLGSAAVRAELARLAELLVPGRRGGRAPAGEAGPGAWNQALMELGAVVCLPRAPRCAECPVRRLCRAAELGVQEERPVAAPRPEPVDVALEVLVCVREEGVLLRRRPDVGRMAGMWELPTREPASPRRLWPGSFGIAGLVRGGSLDRVRHSITRHRITVDVLSGALEGAPAGGDAAFFAPEAAHELALTGMTRKVLRRRTIEGLLVQSGPRRLSSRGAAPRRRGGR